MKLVDRLRAPLASVFGIDLRTLALFRVSLAAVLLWTIVQRIFLAGAFYADSGVLPRPWLLSLDSPWRWSLQYLNGTTGYQLFLLAIAAALAFAVLLGYRTRLASVLSWLLLVSLHNRNPLILTGGDYLMVCLLFWGMFLPLAARWSVDAALSTRPPPTDKLHLSWASAGLVLQVLSVYFFSAILKASPDWWRDGTAVYYALQADLYAKPIGVWLRQFPGVMQALTYYVYFLELLGPLLALLPWGQRPLRFVVMIGLMLMHLGFVFTLSIGHFPFVSLASLTVLLAGWWWDWAERRVDHGRHIKIFYDRDCGFCLKSCLLLRQLLVLPRCEILPAQDSARARALMEAHFSWVVVDADDVAHTKWRAFVALLHHSLLFGKVAGLAGLKVWERPGDFVYDWVGRHRDIFGQIFARLLARRDERFEVGTWAQRLAGAALVVVLSWNLATIKVLPPQSNELLSPAVFVLRLDQVWDMFAPTPIRDDGWWVIPGVREDGREIDVLHPERPAVSYQKPRSVSGEHGNIRWQAYRKRLYDRRFRHHRLYYARYLCREWSRHHEPGERLVTLKLIYMLERTQRPGVEPAIEQRVLWRHECVTSAEAAKPDDAEPD